MENQIKIFKGRPFDTCREDKELKVYDMLDSIGVEYFRVDHPVTDTMEECREIDKVLGVSMCKNLFLCNRQSTKFYLLMMPGDKPFRTRDLSSQLASNRLSFADEKYMEEYLNIKPGAVSVMGLMNDGEKHVQLVIDEEILKDESVGCHPCVNTSSLSIKIDDLLNKFLPAVEHDYIAVKL